VLERLEPLRRRGLRPGTESETVLVWVNAWKSFYSEDIVSGGFGCERPFLFLKLVSDNVD